MFFRSLENTARQLTTLLKLALRKTGNREDDGGKEEEEGRGKNNSHKRFKVSCAFFSYLFHQKTHPQFLVFRVFKPSYIDSLFLFPITLVP